MRVRVHATACENCIDMGTATHKGAAATARKLRQSASIVTTTMTAWAPLLDRNYNANKTPDADAANLC